VMVVDTSRWSRDNYKSKEYLKILKAHGIRFFLGTREMDLSKAQDNLFVGMSTEIAEFFAREQAEKSMLNKIERAKQGQPSSGRKPWDRLFDRETKTWKVDPEKKKMAEQMAQAYLKGLNFQQVGERFNMAADRVWKILTKRSGEDWEINFHGKLTNLQDQVKMKIPRLLDDRVIQAIHRKVEANRSWEHGAIFNKYLLTRMVFDARTDRALLGATYKANQDNPKMPQKRKYYRTSDKSFSIRCERLESAFLKELAITLGSTEEMKKAVYNNQPIANVQADLLEKKIGLEKDLAGYNRRMERFVSGLGETDDVKGYTASIKEKLLDLDQKIDKAQEELKAIERQLSTLPKVEAIEKERNILLDQIKERHRESILSSGVAFKKMEFDKLRKLLLSIFGGKDLDGKRYGIYLEPVKIKGRQRPDFHFTAYGRLGEFEGLVDIVDLYLPYRYKKE